MRSSKLTLNEFYNFISDLKYDLEKFDVSNLVQYCRESNVSCSTATVLKGMELVEKRGKFYQWIGGKVDFGLVEIIRETDNQYKNYAV